MIPTWPWLPAVEIIGDFSAHGVGRAALRITVGVGTRARVLRIRDQTFAAVLNDPRIMITELTAFASSRLNIVLRRIVLTGPWCRIFNATGEVTALARANLAALALARVWVVLTRPGRIFDLNEASIRSFSLHRGSTMV